MSIAWVIKPVVLVARKASNNPGQFGLVDIVLTAYQLGETTNKIGSIVVNTGTRSSSVQDYSAMSAKDNLNPVLKVYFILALWNGLKSLKWWTANFLLTMMLSLLLFKSPIWMMIDPRRTIGFHLDGNRIRPGSAGCLVFKTDADMKICKLNFNGLGHSNALLRLGFGFYQSTW